jgi:regulatory protein
MQTITRISTPPRQPNRRRVYLDGKFAFACGVNVLARYRLRQGMMLSEDKLRDVEQGEIRQNCLDRAMRFLEARLHSRTELQRKLQRGEFAPAVIAQVLDDLARLGVVDDERFSRVRVAMASAHKHHGRRRVMGDLLKRGISKEIAERALGETYDATMELTTAGQLAEKHALRLSKLDPAVARRRLAGLLSRRGFEYEQVSDVIDSVLGRQREGGGESI